MSEAAPSSTANPPRSKTSLVIWALWTSIALVEATHYYFVRSLGPDPVTIVHALKVSLLRWWLWAAFTPLIRGVAERFPLERGLLARNGAIHIAAASAFTAANLVIGGTLYYYLIYSGSSRWADLLVSYAGIHSAMALITYGAIVGAHVAWTNHVRFRQREIEAARLAMRSAQLEHRLSESRLALLQSQLHPHFLFNTLHGVSGLVLKGASEDAIRMISLLSDMLRLSLEDVPAHVVPLAREIQLLDVYCDIQMIRFRDRLVIRKRIPNDLLDARVPIFLLQPLTENAIRHGIEKIRGRGTIEIRAHARSGRDGARWLVLSVRNSGPGPGLTNQRSLRGLGLKNTRARLRELYGRNQRLTLASAPDGGCLVRVRLPLRRSADEQGETESMAAGAVAASPAPDSRLAAGPDRSEGSARGHAEGGR
ncbi:MAG: histidine kinase [Gemmatimonadetes bacterium]|nr:histidine kinase [Gemmatimonadota bacterium]